MLDLPQIQADDESISNTALCLVILMNSQKMPKIFNAKNLFAWYKTSESEKKLFNQVLDAKLIYAKMLQNVKTQTF